MSDLPDNPISCDHRDEIFRIEPDLYAKCQTCGLETKNDAEFWRTTGGVLIQLQMASNGYKTIEDFLAGQVPND